MDIKTHLHKLFYDEDYQVQDQERCRKAMEEYRLKFEKCSILKETNSHYSGSSEMTQIVKDRTYLFSLICNCGATINGVILNGSKSDKLHCNCGLVWEVNKPLKEE